MTVKIAPPPRQQFLDASGDPYSGAKLFTYISGTTTKENTYTTSVGDVANTNPIVLDSSGRTPFGVWLTAGVTYKFVLAPSTDTDPPASPIFTEDVVSGTNDTATISGSQWAASAMTPTYVSGTQFTVVGDQTSTLDVGRRCQFSVSAGTVYGNILTSAYTSLTTVTMTMDAGDALDAGLTSFNVGILSGTNHSVPKISDALWIQNGVAVVGSANAFTGNDTHAGAETYSGGLTIDTVPVTMTDVAINHALGTVAAHATTCDIWAAGGNEVTLTGGVVTFTDFADAPQAGAVRYVKANDAHILTDGANIEVQGNANYTCTANDILRVFAKSTTTFKVDVFASAVQPDLASLTTVQAGTSTTQAPSVSSMQQGKIVLPAAMVAFNSSATYNVGSIPSWVKRINIFFFGVSTSGTDQPIVQIGDSGGIETTGYLGSPSSLAAAGDGHSLVTTGFGMETVTGSAAFVRHGKMVIELIDSATNTWIATYMSSNSDAARGDIGSGSKQLSGTLTQFTFTTLSGSDTWDAGNISYTYE